MSATQGQPVPFEVVKQGNNAFGIKERAEQLIQNEADWARVWTSLESTTVPRPPVQPVDFAKQTLIAVFAGEKRTGGYKIRIEAVRAQAKKLVVDVLESSPGAGMVATMAFTSPYQVISVPKGEYELHVNRSSK